MNFPMQNKEYSIYRCFNSIGIATGQWIVEDKSSDYPKKIIFNGYGMALEWIKNDIQAIN